jgi:hypothetical protein
MLDSQDYWPASVRMESKGIGEWDLILFQSYLGVITSKWINVPSNFTAYRHLRSLGPIKVTSNRRSDQQRGCEAKKTTATVHILAYDPCNYQVFDHVQKQYSTAVWVISSSIHF